MKRLRIIIAGMLMVLGLGTAALQPVAAINVFKNCSGSEICDEARNGEKGAGKLAQDVISTLLFVLGIICVIIIIVGGILYATSGGDSTKTKRAKDTVLYAVVGLVVALLAYAIVNFVLNQIG